MQKAITHKGFSFIEIRSQCPTSYGRRINQRRGSDTLQEYKESSVRIKDASNMNPDELKDKIIIGKLIESEKGEFTEKLRQLNIKIRNEKLVRYPEEWSIS